jgi:hypothetical protein
MVLLSVWQITAGSASRAVLGFGSPRDPRPTLFCLTMVCYTSVSAKVLLVFANAVIPGSGLH